MLTVCIVEDQDNVRSRVQTLVNKMSMVNVLGSFATAEDAIDHLPTLNPALTICDIGLPGMKGTEAIARLVADGFKGDFIMFTMFDSDEHLFRALELGACGYILKEEGPRGVTSAITEYRKGGAPMSPTLARRVLRSFKNPSISGLKAKFEQLTEKQLSILELMSEGLLNKQIAERLNVTEGTIRQHNYRIYRKLSVNNRAEAIRLYLSKPMN